jgi:hypothetical protein
MAENGREQKKTPRQGKADLQLIVLLAAGYSVAEAAKETGISERTIYRRKREHDFAMAIGDARETMLDQTLGKLMALMGKGADVLGALLESENEKTRLLAAHRILTNSLNVRGFAVHEVRIQAIEQAIAESGMI